MRAIGVVRRIPYIPYIEWVTPLKWRREDDEFEDRKNMAYESEVTGQEKKKDSNRGTFLRQV